MIAYIKDIVNLAQKSMCAKQSVLTIASHTIKITKNGDYVTVNIRTINDLLAHIKGSAYWQTYRTLNP